MYCLQFHFVLYRETEFFLAAFQRTICPFSILAFQGTDQFLNINTTDQ